MSAKKAPLDLNVVVLVGSLSRPPQFRVLKDGRSVTNLDLRVQGIDGPETVRVSWFEAPAAALDYDEGDGFAVVGKVRRFWFSGRQSITDVVAERVTPIRLTGKVRRSLGDAMARLQEASP